MSSSNRLFDMPYGYATFREMVSHTRAAFLLITLKIITSIRDSPSQSLSSSSSEKLLHAYEPSPLLSSPSPCWYSPSIRKHLCVVTQTSARASQCFELGIPFTRYTPTEGSSTQWLGSGHVQCASVSYLNFEGGCYQNTCLTQIVCTYGKEIIYIGQIYIKIRHINNIERIRTNTYRQSLTPVDFLSP